MEVKEQSKPALPESENIIKMKQNFQIFGIATFLYACLYVFCMYKNASGITYLLFVAGGLFYIHFCLKHLGMENKKGRFYQVCMILLAISTFCTDDGRIIFFNKVGVFLLALSFLLDVFYSTGKWNLGKYLHSIARTCTDALGELGSPVADATWYCKNKLDKQNKKYLYLLVGIFITIPVFIMVFALLTSADVVFKHMADKAVGNLDLGDLVPIALQFAVFFLICYGILSALCKKKLVEEVPDKRTGEPLIAIPVAGGLTLLYLVFSGVQVLYLFIGNMELPDGYTYAEYAREGFFQLLAVSILNLIMVLVGLCYFKKNGVLKVILTIMSACTFVMIASSALRMVIYIQYYYLTFLRILVLWGLLLLTIIFAGVVVYIFKENFPLFRYSVVAVTCMYLLLSFGHPDYWIAKVNVAGMSDDRSKFFKGTAYSDFYFLTDLSMDATPILLEYLKEEGFDTSYIFDGDIDDDLYEERGFISFQGYEWMGEMRDYTENVSWRKFNLSRFWAKQKALKIE